MKRIFKIILIVVALALTGGIIYTLIHLNAVMLMVGKGSLKLPDYAATEKAFKASSAYTVTDSSGTDGSKGMTCTSNDKAVTMQIQEKSGTETITGTVDTDKLPQVNKKDPAAIKKTAETYLKPLLTEDQIVGLAGYAMKENLAGSGNTSLSQTYGGTTVNASKGENGKINFTITKKNKG